MERDSEPARFVERPLIAKVGVGQSVPPLKGAPSSVRPTISHTGVLGAAPVSVTPSGVEGSSRPAPASSAWPAVPATPPPRSFQVRNGTRPSRRPCRRGRAERSDRRCRCTASTLAANSHRRGIDPQRIGVDVAQARPAALDVAESHRDRAPSHDDGEGTDASRTIVLLRTTIVPLLVTTSSPSNEQFVIVVVRLWPAMPMTRSPSISSVAVLRAKTQLVSVAKSGAGTPVASSISS